MLKNKNKVKRRLSGVLMVCCALLMLSLPVSAAEKTGVGVRAALCPDCNIGSMQVTYGSWGAWYVIQEVKCIHHPRGTDTIEERQRIATNRCNYCGSGGSKVEKATRRVCHGYNQ